MLTTLKDIFRPTSKKLVWAFGIGLPLTLLGSLFAIQYHGPSYYPHLAAVLLLPIWLVQNVWWLQWAKEFWNSSLTGTTEIIFEAAIQFVYYYVLVSFASFLFGLGRKRK